MKATSYEISKKLHEAGFRADSCGGWFVEGGFSLESKLGSPFDWLAYDLETILDALPAHIVIEGGDSGDDTGSGGDGRNGAFTMTKESCVYNRDDFYENGYPLLDLYEYKEENGSLADTAARLLIMLVEKGLLTFKK